PLLVYSQRRSENSSVHRIDAGRRVAYREGKDSVSGSQLSLQPKHSGTARRRKRRDDWSVRAGQRFGNAGPRRFVDAGAESETVPFHVAIRGGLIGNGTNAAFDGEQSIGAPADRRHSSQRAPA